MNRTHAALRLTTLALALLSPAAALGQGGDAPKPAEAPPRLLIDTQGFASRVESLDFSPAGDLLAAGGDKVVRIWEVATGRLTATLRGYDDGTGNGLCMVVRFSPDGKNLLVGVQDFYQGGALRVYDTADLSEIQTLLPGHTSGGVADLAFSADGRYLASLGVNGGVIVWDWPARKQIGEVASPSRLVHFGFPAAAPLLVTVDDQGPHWVSAPHAKDVRTLTPQDLAALGTPEVVNAAYAAAQGVSTALQRALAGLPFGGSPGFGAVFGREAGRLVLGGVGKENGADRYWVHVWSAAGEPLLRYDGHRFTPTAAAVRRDGTAAASADGQGQVDVWEPATGRRIARFVARGSSVYTAAFDASGSKLVYGNVPYGPDRWNFNAYGAPGRTFDLAKRTLSANVPATAPQPGVTAGERRLTFQRDAASHSDVFASYRGNAAESFYAFAPNVTALCFGYLRGARPGRENFVVVGCDDNNLVALDPTEMIRGRKFLGHTGAVYAAGESPDGRLLVSGSADRTLRVWSLGPIVDMGGPDFDVYGDGQVSFLRPGGLAERAGVRVGDTLLKMGGMDLGVVYDRMLAGVRDFAPGQRVGLTLSRAGRPYQATVDFIAAGDFVEPLLSLFVADDDWVLWTPSGYYDASPGGDRLVGWHVNRGREKAAAFYTVHQFRKQFYRPDVIDRVLETGDVARAVALANADRPRSTEALDLRKSDDMKRVVPPRVTLREPRAGHRTAARTVRVKAAVESPQDRPIGTVKVLLNGRPVSGRDLPRRPGDTDTHREVDLDVELEPGANRVSVLATDRASKSSSRPQDVLVVRDAAQGDDDEKPRVFLLAIGVSKYARPGKVRNLQFAHVDARTFADAWAAQSGRLYAEVKTRVLLDEQATVAGIREGFDWLLGSATRKDFAVIYVAAHGVADESRGGYFIAAHEVDTSRLLSTAIPDRDLIAVAESLRCRRALVFLDTCHAGGIEGARPATAEALNELTSDEVGAVMFGACEPRELSLEDPQWGHGAFTKALLDVFGDPRQDPPPADGKLSTDEVQLLLRRRVPALTDDEQHPVVNLPPSVRNFDFFAFPDPAQAGRGGPTGTSR